MTSISKQNHIHMNSGHVHLQFFIHRLVVCDFLYILMVVSLLNTLLTIGISQEHASNLCFIKCVTLI